MPLTVMKVRPPSRVRCNVFSTESNKIRPTIHEIVGSNSAPQKIRVAETGSDSAGVAGFDDAGSSSS